MYFTHFQLLDYYFRLTDVTTGSPRFGEFPRAVQTHEVFLFGDYWKGWMMFCQVVKYLTAIYIPIVWSVEYSVWCVGCDLVSCYNMTLEVLQVPLDKFGFGFEFANSTPPNSTYRKTSINVPIQRVDLSVINIDCFTTSRWHNISTILNSSSLARLRDRWMSILVWFVFTSSRRRSCWLIW